MKEIKKAKMSQIVEGTTTTEMIEVGVIVENEYAEGQVGIGKPIIVTIPEPGDSLINSSSKGLIK